MAANANQNKGEASSAAVCVSSLGGMEVIIGLLTHRVSSVSAQCRQC